MPSHSEQTEKSEKRRESIMNDTEEMPASEIMKQAKEMAEGGKGKKGEPIDIEKKVISDNQDETPKVEFGKVEDEPIIVTPPKNVKSYIMSYAIIAVLVGVVAFLIGALLPFLILIIGLIMSGLIIWFVLAPRNIVWNFTPEATSKIIVRGDSFIGATIQWTGYTFDDNWHVIPEDRNHKEPWHFGGLRFNGKIPLLDTVFEYPLRWKSVRLKAEENNGEGEIVKFHEENLDFIALRPEVYYTKIFSAETKPPERLALNIEFLTTIQVFGPYDVSFKAPYNWLENAMIRVSALYTNWVATKTLDDLLEVKDNPDKMWQELGENELIKIFIKEWGVRVPKHGVQIRKIDMPADYQNAIAEEKKQKLKAAGRAAETIGTLLASVAYISGKTIAEVQEEIQKDPTRQEQYLKIAQDLITRKIAIEGGSYLDIRTEGAEGLEKLLLNVFAAWQRMPKGK